MASESNSNSDSDDLVLIELKTTTATSSRKRKSTSNLDDDLDDLLYDNNFKNKTKRQSLVIDNKKNSITPKASLVTTTTSNLININNDDNNLNRKLQLSDRIDRLCEYAQILMHCLLFKINYYNKKTHFDKLLKYNTIVYKCKSEIVCEYITNCIECMRLLLYAKHNLDKDDDDLDQTNDITEDNTIFSIGLAVLNSSSSSLNENSLIKRYTLQIENLLTDDLDLNGSNLEWEFRDSLLRCLYSKEFNHNWSNYKWQIQIRTKQSKMKKLTQRDDLFKIFAWRECDKCELNTVTTKQGATSSNKISLQPIKTMNSLKIQLFIEQPIAASSSRKIN